MSKLADGDLLSLLPASISDDPQMRAAAEALAPVLKSLSLSLPNLLVFSRLGGQPEEGMLPPLARLTRARGGLKPLSLEELEQLAWQFHVDFREVATTREQLAAMVRESIPWHRIKGTPASIKAALGLFGISAVIEEDGRGDDWATYQLGVSGAPDMETVRQAYQVATEMAPARCRLFRIYNDQYDFRPIYLTDGPPLGEGWLSFYSGVIVPGIGDGEDAPLVSFGALLSLAGEPLGSRIWYGGLGTTCLSGRYEDCFIVGESHLGDVFPVPHSFVVSHLISWQNADRVATSHKWRGAWKSGRRWAEPAGWTRIAPLAQHDVLTLYKSQLRLGWPDDAGGLVHGSGTLGDINACPGVRLARHWDAPIVVGESPLGHDPDRREEIIEEFFILPEICVPFAGAQPAAPQYGRAGLLSLSGAPLREQGWRGTWRKRKRWWSYRAEYGLVGTMGLSGAPLTDMRVHCGREGLLALQGEAVNPPAPESGRVGSMNVSGAPLHNQHWRGSWKGRRWWNYQGGGAAVITKET